MRTRTIAVMELLLIFPAALFMTALVLRNLQSRPYEPTHSAQHLVMWYAARMWTLWVLLLGLPLIVLVIGCTALRRCWKGDMAREWPAMLRRKLAALFIAATTLAAGVILAIVVLHMLAN